MRKQLIIAFAAAMCLNAEAQNMAVRWHNEAADTAKIVSMLSEAASVKFDNPSQRVAWFGHHFLGLPYGAHTLEGETEEVTINLDSIDCTTFVDNALALAATSGERRQGWQDFVFNLRNMRYRGGEVNGYASRLHYNCDWATDNIHRGNLADITPNSEKCKYMVRTIDFMTAHRDRYTGLADSVQFDKIRAVEEGYRNHRFPYIKTADLNHKPFVAMLREGDILAFVSNLKDLDVTHLGIVVKGEDGKPHVMHASSTNGKVEISNVPLYEFVKRNLYWIGVRVYRLKE